MAAPDGLVSALSGSYRIERELGAGGMATVFLAEDLKHQRKVAVKVLRPELAATLGPERFLREVTIAANLQHPHVLPLYDSGQASGFLYYVMPFVEGTSLRQKVVREGELPVPEAVRLLRDVADAMAYAHQRGVVHRDIKPENVMLSGRHALVTDFGVAKAVSEATGRRTLTTAGVALGTPTYMAPEQAVADPHTDHRADIYAFGVMAYELLTGRPPFVGATPQSVLAAHVTMAAEPVTKYRASIPPALATLVMRCLEKKPADRWQSADELIPQLEAVLTLSGGMTPPATHPMPAIPGRTISLWALGGLTAVVLVVALLIVMRKSRSPLAPITASLERVQLTTAGNVYYPTLSPDGSRLAYVAWRCARAVCAYDLVVRDLASGDTLTVVPRATSISGGNWTPDSRFLQFNGRPEGQQQGVYVVSTLGGSPRYYGCCDGSLTPDGDTLVIRGPPPVSGAEWLRYVSRSDGQVRDSILLERQGTVGGPMVDRTLLTVLAQTRSSRWLLRVLDRQGRVTDTLPLALPASLPGVYADLVPDGRGFAVSLWRGLSGDYDIVRYGVSSNGKLTGVADTVVRQLPLTFGAFKVTTQNSLVFAQQVGEYQVQELERTSTEWKQRSATVPPSPVAPWAHLSPRSEEIAFLRLSTTGGRPRVDLTVRSLGSGSVRSLRSFDRVSSFEWTRDGQGIVLAEPIGAAASRIHFIAPPSTRVRDLGTVASGAPFVSGAGEGLVVWSDGFTHVSVLDSSGKSRRITELTPDRPVVGLSMTPSGSEVFVLRGSADMDGVGYDVRVINVETGAQTVLATSRDAIALGATSSDSGSLLVATISTSGSTRVSMIQIGPQTDQVVRLGDVDYVDPVAEASLAANGKRAIVTTWRGRSDAYMIRGPILGPVPRR